MGLLLAAAFPPARAQGVRRRDFYLYPPAAKTSLRRLVVLGTRQRFNAIEIRIGRWRDAHDPRVGWRGFQPAGQKRARSV